MTREDELDALYADLPKVDCIGACWDSCSRIAMTSLERTRTEKAGVFIPDGRFLDAPSMCPALTMLHQCGIYAVRPMICRLWGVAEGLRCTFGCMPLDGRRLLTDRETYEYLARAHDIAGEHTEAAAIREPWIKDPERAERIMREQRQRNQDKLLARDVRRRALRESGKPLLYVRGYGQISKDPPASGANSS